MSEPVLSARGVRKNYRSGDAVLEVLRDSFGIASTHTDERNIRLERPPTR